MKQKMPPSRQALLDVPATQLTVVPADTHGCTRNTTKIAVRTEPNILALLAFQFYWSFKAKKHTKLTEKRFSF